MKKHFKFWMSLSWSDRLAALLFWLLVIASSIVLSSCAAVKAVHGSFDSDTGSGSVMLELLEPKGGSK